MTFKFNHLWKWYKGIFKTIWNQYEDEWSKQMILNILSIIIFSYCIYEFIIIIKNTINKNMYFNYIFYYYLLLFVCIIIIHYYCCHFFLDFFVL